MLWNSCSRSRRYCSTSICASSLACFSRRAFPEGRARAQGVGVDPPKCDSEGVSPHQPRVTPLRPRLQPTAPQAWVFPRTPLPRFPPRLPGKGVRTHASWHLPPSQRPASQPAAAAGYPGTDWPSLSLGLMLLRPLTKVPDGSHRRLQLVLQSSTTPWVLALPLLAQPPAPGVSPIGSRHCRPRLAAGQYPGEAAGGQQRPGAGSRCRPGRRCGPAMGTGAETRAALGWEEARWRTQHGVVDGMRR